MKKIWIVLTMLVLAGTMPLAAQSERESTELQTRMSTLDKTSSGLGEEKVLNKFSEQLGVSYEVLAQQKQQTGLGMGELFVANSLATSLQATAPDKTFDALVQEFQSGKGWGEIAKENGVSLGKVVSQMKRSNTALERELKTQTRNAGTQRANNGSGTRSGKSNSNTGHRGGGSAGHGRN